MNWLQILLLVCAGTNMALCVINVRLLFKLRKLHKKEKEVLDELCSMRAKAAAFIFAASMQHDDEKPPASLH